MDEISVTEENKKLAKSTWDSLDVQGSGFELLAKPIVSRLGNQDVTKSQGDKPKQWNLDSQRKEEYIQSTVTTTEKSRRDALTQKYKSISKHVNANINLQQRDDYNLKSKEKAKDKDKTKTYGVSKQYKKEDESEITTESHISKKVIVDIKKKVEQPKIKPRRRDEGDNISESISHHSQKVTVDIKHKEKRNLTRPRRREDESENSSENLSNISRKVIIETKGDKTNAQRSQSYINKNVVAVRPRRREEESENASESMSHISKKVITDIKDKDKKYIISQKQTSTITGRKRQGDQEQQYLSKKIAITPPKEEMQKQETKYYNKNIVIQPVATGTKVEETSRTGSSSGYRANVQQYQIQQSKSGARGVYSGYGNTADIIKDVKYFNKNIVIEPVQQRKYNIQNVSIKGSETKYQKQSGYEVSKTSSRGRERRPWEIDAKSGEDVFFGRLSGDSEVINEDMLKNIPGIDENTKLYHKEITITPVIVPPPKFSQQ